MIKSKTVINTRNNKLCCGCGLCKVSCPNKAIEISFDKNKEYKPFINKNKCNNCGICLKICPMSIDNLALRILHAAKQQDNYGLENTLDCYIGYETDEKKYIDSASGGMLSALLIYLLEKKYIDAVVHAQSLHGNKNKKYFQAAVSTSTGDINSRRSSFYYPIEFSTVLENIKKNDNISNIAFVGVPCVLSGLEKLLEFDKVLRKKIKYRFSLICSHNVSGQFADCLIRGFPYIEQDKKLIFRDKHEINHAGNFNNLIELKNKKQIRKSRYESPYTIQWRSYSYAVNACFYCPDFFGVSSDAAFKDAWGFNNLSRNKGETVCIINNG
ncbi:Coenzyme F420 hydrogenase/dehydrogenase, beta subunit C-terminal domain, partial [bacterium]|nr:Coenzyme F420 hydrogenase/dehydrogenase, beta subunit C-terminal domain [bacterium]